MAQMNSDSVKKKCVLLAEDESSLRLILTTKLQQAGYTVIEAQDGEKALERALTYHPDLIISDILMPKMDGMTMLHSLRQDAWGANAKVIILTNYDADDSKIGNVITDKPSYYLLKSNNTLEDVVSSVNTILTEQ